MSYVSINSVGRQPRQSVAIMMLLPDKTLACRIPVIPAGTKTFQLILLIISSYTYLANISTNFTIDFDYQGFSKTKKNLPLTTGKHKSVGQAEFNLVLSCFT